MRAKAPEIPWRNILAMRNRIVHHYFGVRLDIVLNVVRNDLPSLVESIERLHRRLVSACEPENDPEP